MEAYLDFAHHHIELFIALGVVLALFIANEVHGQISGAPTVGPQDAVRLINDREALILDVRPVADYKKGHIMNSLNLPLARMNDRLTELPKDKARPIIVCCALGTSAAEAARKLTAEGYTEVYPLRGGIEAWLSASLPITAK